MTEEKQTPQNTDEQANGTERRLPGHPVLDELIGAFEDVEWQPSHGQNVVFSAAERYIELAAAAKQAGFEILADLTAVDYLRSKRHRFEVVAMLLSMSHNLRLRVRVPVSRRDPQVPSLVPVYPGAGFFEREAYDMFGITFTDHPDLTRILMPDDWVGYPLRKDYAVGFVPVQFKASPRGT